jgi:hypothetical protein
MVPAGAGRVLVAPITVSPTKPLTPTHVRYLLIIDALCRATGTIADLTCVYDHLAFASGGQTVAFWEYLDRVRPGVDLLSATEEDIGELYVRHHGERAPVPGRVLAPYVERVQGEGWMHPSAVRMLDIWRGHYRTLDLFDETLGLHGPPRMPDAEVIGLLAERNLCLDGRPVRAPVYLDLTAQGIPLRGLVSSDGQANYLLCILGQLIPLVAGYDMTVLMYDRELRDDYVLIDRVLRVFGAHVARFEVDRVAIDDVVASSRFGGWRGYTLPSIRRQVDADDEVFRLALRLYLIASIGPGRVQSFRIEELRRWAVRAEALQDRAVEDGGDLQSFLLRMARGTGYVNPHRLVAALLTRSRAVPARSLLEMLGRRRPDGVSRRTA